MLTFMTSKEITFPSIEIVLWIRTLKGTKNFQQDITGMT